VLVQLACTDKGSNIGNPDYGLEDVGSADHLADLLFSDDALPAFALELSEDSLQALRDEPYSYVEGSLIFEDKRFESVGIRTKGENSWQPIDEKPSLKIKLNWAVKGLRFRGLEELTFNSMNDDHSMMHERVGYRMYREAGVPAARATHATLQINDESYGLYTHVETVDRDLIGRWFSDDEGSLFELNDADYTEEYLDGFELEYSESDDPETYQANLQGTADALKLEDPGAALEAIEEHLDLDQFLLYWAVSAYIGQFDSYPYSIPGDDCHVYDDPSSGVLHTLPHGIDESFYSGSKNVLDSTVGLLATTCLQSSDCVLRLESALATVLDLAEENDLHGYFLGVRDQVSPLIEADTHHSHDERDIEYYQEAMGSFITERRTELEQQLEDSR
jgi:spore coat protein CotH